MFTQFGTTIYVTNQVLFFILIALFYAAGIKLANKVIPQNGITRRMRSSVAVSCPAGLLVSFFAIDSLSLATDRFCEFELPFSILAYWATITFVGIILSAIFAFITIRSTRKKICFSQASDPQKIEMANRDDVK